MESLEKPPLQHIFSSNLVRIRSFLSLCDAVLPEFGNDRRPDMSVDCLLYFVKHMLTNEEMVFLSSQLHCTSLCAVFGAKFTWQRPVIKMRWPDLGFWGKKILEVSVRLIELLGFDFPDVLILFSRFCGWVFLLGFFFFQAVLLLVWGACLYLELDPKDSKAINICSCWASLAAFYE